MEPYRDIQNEGLLEAIQRNIELMAKIERDFAGQRSPGERVADAIANFAGSLAFFVVHVVIVASWILINAGAIPFIPPFDPFPFILLSATFSVEAIFLSTFVLMKQNRMSRQTDQRAQLDLQINLLAEREMTLVLQMLQSIATRLGVRPTSDEIQHLSEETPVETLASELRDKLPGE